MKSNILVVEDDQEMLSSLKDSIEISSDKVAVVTANDGVAAIQKLESDPVNLVVTDYRMPRMDGLSLMGEINRRYPDIPVIFVTGHGSPETEYMARSTGAADYIVKPFKIDDLITKIASAISSQSDGGTLHNVSAATFLQLIKMEEQECTIRLTERSSRKQGVLFFKGGNLLDARFLNLRSEEAAYEIFSWDDVSLQIQNGCPLDTPKIRKGLQAILMDAMLLKDERKQKLAEASIRKESGAQPKRPVRAAVSSGPKKPAPAQPAASKPSIAEALGKQIGVENIFQDTSWEPKLSGFSNLGNLFGSGPLKVAYIVKKTDDRYLLLPQRNYTVIVVNDKCHRDELMSNLGRLS
jgi:DNA-binding response OmpR family regulator